MDEQPIAERKSGGDQPTSSSAPSARGLHGLLKMDENPSDRNGSRALFAIFAAFFITAGIGAGMLALLKLADRLQVSLGQLVTMNERIVELTSKVKETGEVALSGTREAHERIDRLDARLAIQEQATTKLRGRIGKMEDSIQVLDNLSDSPPDVRVETDNPQKPNDAADLPWPPAMPQ